MVTLCAMRRVAQAAGGRAVNIISGSGNGAGARCLSASASLLSTPSSHADRALTVDIDNRRIRKGRDMAVVSRDAKAFNVTMNRPDAFNTFSDKVIAEFATVWSELGAEQGLRGCFLASSGRFFSAGADLNWMKNSVNYTQAQNQADAEALSEMLASLNTLPCATIALVQGPAFGGGVGLVSCCDIAVAVESASFTLSEVKLGIIPATISPFVVARIGAAQSRRYMLTAEPITASRAKEINLVHEVVPDTESLATWEQKLKDSLLMAGPTAVAASKQLVWTVTNPDLAPRVSVVTAEALAVQRASEEGQAGLGAFFARQPAPWVPARLQPPSRRK